jgi:tetratricopeptide (TPR) repeat protein
MDPQALFAQHCDDLRRAAVEGGGVAVVEMIAGLPTFGERLVLYTLARQALSPASGIPGALDVLSDVADAATGECEALLSLTSDPGSAQELLRALHMLNFNLAADLADCWPDDDRPRQTHHFERGLDAADYLLGPVFQGAVAPRALANDHWVRGMHLLSLGRQEEAAACWDEALRHAREAAVRLGAPAGGPESTLQVLLLEGYNGIAGFVRGDREGGGRRLAQAAADLRRRAEREDEAKEALYLLGQLEKVCSRYAPAMPAGN